MKSLKACMWLACLCLPGFTLPAQARVVEQAPQRFTIENSEWVPVTPTEAWQAMTDDVGRWWPADHTWWGDSTRLSLSDQVGGCFCEKDGARQAWHMSVVHIEPARLLRMTGGLGPLQGMGVDGVMEWRLTEENNGTRITWWYRAGGQVPDDLTKLAPIVDRVQGEQLGGLARHLRQGRAN